MRIPGGEERMEGSVAFLGLWTSVGGKEQTLECERAYVKQESEPHGYFTDR